ncbi:PHA/PHB synthase family protein [Nocardioides insulae]|uniref:PHA/PHB synthase family protein n=1 Tax=Nocardioides insulae TaxID=394734 RepID=UPI0003F87DCF|nr:alpha/beta fold hydrolase [Nocardioides insulae]
MSAEPIETAGPLDQLLTQSTAGMVRRLLPAGPAVKFLGAASRRPERVATRVGGLVAELARIGIGVSTVAPARKDRRFADPAWTENPLLRRVVQSYLAASVTAEGLVQDVPMSWSDSERMGFAVSNLVEAASPSNNPLLSPVAWKAAIDTGGANLIKGPRNLLRDLASAPRVPSMVDPDAYQVGADLAITPGAVVLRTPIFELIQYKPQTETVRAAPLLVIPPTINKYYILDLAPGRSLIEYLVQQGQQVFVMSWRNPDSRHSKWGFDAYAEGIIESFRAVDRITGAGAVHVMAACSGGLLAALTTAERATVGKIDRLASLSLLVTMIDQSRSGVTTAMVDESVAANAVARSRLKGYLDGRSLAEVFAWLRPSDLIWNYWVNNYLQGKNPPKFDILFWNADTTRMPAKLHRDFVDAALNNKLAQPGAITLLGTEVDLSRITVDSYVVAGSADHICPWTNCYRSGQLLGGKVRFVLSTNGHIAALVNPPGNPKSSYQVMDDNTLDPVEWQEAAQREQGSWWPDYSQWLEARSGDQVPAPEELGSVDFRPLEEAPGSYVRDR